MFRKIFKKKPNKGMSDQIIELIEGVIFKRKMIHLKYEGLIKSLIKSDRTKDRKLSVSKYIMHRILRESDRAFVKAQIKASSLCSCKQQQAFEIDNDDNHPRVYH